MSVANENLYECRTPYATVMTSQQDILLYITDLLTPVQSDIMQQHLHLHLHL